jgi:thioredoxin 1
MALEITDANFDETIKTGVVLVDFWALRCPPCRAQGPIVDKLATKYEGKATIGKLDVDENSETPAKFGVMYIPTLLLFKNGVKVQQFTGLQDEKTLSAALDAQL